MDNQLPFILMIESVGLVLAIIAIWSFIWSKRTHNDRKIQAALESHLHGVLTAELELVDKELKKSVRAALADATIVLRSNHEKLSSESSELLAAFATTINAEMTQMLHEQHKHIEEVFNTKQAQVLEELEQYRKQKITELDSNSEKLLLKVVQRKAWKMVQNSDQHAIAKQAVQEIVASGELTV
jgi:hypothetical protein